MDNYLSKTKRKPDFLPLSYPFSDDVNKAQLEIPALESKAEIMQQISECSRESITDAASDAYIHFLKAKEYIPDDQLLKVLLLDFEKLEKGEKELYRLMLKAREMFNDLSENELGTERIFGSYSEAFGFKMAIDAQHDTAYFSIPYPSKTTHRSLSYKTPYIDDFKAFVQENVRKNEEPINAKKLPFVLHFIHIYASSASQSIRDNDNYEYHELIDIITDLFFLGDIGDRCTLVYETLISDDLPDGTYIILTPKAGNFTLGEANISKLKSALFDPVSTPKTGKKN